MLNTCGKYSHVDVSCISVWMLGELVALQLSLGSELFSTVTTLVAIPGMDQELWEQEQQVLA